MKIHSRTLLILGATIFVLIFSLSILAQFFILTTYTQIEQATALLSFFAIAIILTGIIYVIITELLLRWYIINPLLGLDASMKEIGRRRDLSERLAITGDDEVASVRQSLNAMLQELQDKETELAKKRDQLAEANRKANLYLDMYLDVLTYEIRNSTMTIHGYADLIRSSDGEKERMYAEHIIETIHKDTEVIQNIETISKIFKNPPAQEAVDLDSVIRSVIKSYPGTSIQCEPRGITVLADRMISSVFDNCITNSIKFGGERVNIAITCRDAGEDMVEISVTDTGPGIPDAQKPGVFDRFMQGSEKRSSFGLGLHIAKMLIEAYGGHIRADDRVPGEPGQGAAIRFTLKKGQSRGQ